MSEQYPIKNVCTCLDLVDKIALEIVLNGHIETIDGEIIGREEWIKKYPQMAKRLHWESLVQMKRAEVKGYQRLKDEIMTIPNCQER